MSATPTTSPKIPLASRPKCRVCSLGLSRLACRFFRAGLCPIANNHPLCLVHLLWVDNPQILFVGDRYVKNLFCLLVWLARSQDVVYFSKPYISGTSNRPRAFIILLLDVHNSHVFIFLFILYTKFRRKSNFYNRVDFWFHGYLWQFDFWFHGYL